MVGAVSICITNGHPIVSFLSEKILVTVWVPICGCHVSSLYGLQWDKIPKRINCLILLSKWHHILAVPRFLLNLKMFVCQGFYFGTLCLCTSLRRWLYKECKHALDLSQSWVALVHVVTTEALHLQLHHESTWSWFQWCLVPIPIALGDWVQPLLAKPVVREAS